MALAYLAFSWLILLVAAARAWVAWGPRVGLFFLVFLVGFRLLPYGNWFTDSAALLIVLRAPPRLL